MIFIASIVTCLFTILLTIAGEGAAIILIPIYTAMGYDLRIAMSTALLLNALAMIFASIRYYKNKLILFKMAIPIIIFAALFSQLGAHVSDMIPNLWLNALFAAFLVFAGVRMLIKKKDDNTDTSHTHKSIVKGVLIGSIAGFLAGLLGIGGGNLIIPVLISMGINSKKASATTAFIVIFSSISGFLGHLGSGSIDFNLVIYTGIGSIAGALIGSWLMTNRLKSVHVKKLIAFVLLFVALKKFWNIIAHFL